MHAQLDYLYFISGLLFLIASVFRHRTAPDGHQDRRRWSRLAIFGAAVCAHDWVEVPDLAIHAWTWIRMLKIVLLLLSFVIYIEFARGGFVSMMKQQKSTKAFVMSLVLAGVCWLSLVPIVGASIEAAVGIPIVMLRILLALLAIVFFPKPTFHVAGFDTGKPINGIRTVLLLGLIVGIGWIGTQWRGQFVAEGMRQKFLRSAVSMAKSLPPEEIRAISLTNENTTTPEYSRIRMQLHAFRRYIGQMRGMFIIGASDTLIGRGPETYATDDSTNMTPRRDAARNDPVWRNAFKTAQPVLVGPCSDDRGAFITAYAPIIWKQTNGVEGIIGVDFPAAEWDHEIARARGISIFLTLVLVMFVLGGWELLSQRNRSSQVHKIRRLRHVEPIVSVCIGAMLTMILMKIVFDIETRKMEQDFDQLSEVHEKKIQSRLVEVQRSLEDLALYFESGSDVTLSEFSSYTAPMNLTLGVQAWAWVPRVMAAEKNTHEISLHRQGQRTYKIFRAHGANVNAVARQRSPYFPSAYIMPLRGNEEAVGFDQASEAVRKLAIDEAIRSRLTVSTGMTSFAAGSENGSCVLVFHPVFEKNTDSVEGLVLAVVRPQQLMDRITVLHPEVYAQIEVQLIDLSGGNRLALTAGRELSEERTNSMYERSSQDSTVYPVLVFGRTWALVARHGKAFNRATPRWYAAAAGAGGCFLTALLTVLVAFIARHKDDLEEKILKGRDELRASDLRFRNLFEQSPDPHLLFFDRHIVDCNDAAVKLLKGTRKQLLGLSILDLSPSMQPDGAISEDKITLLRQQNLSNKSVHIEWLGKKLDGTLFWAEASRTVLAVDERSISFLSFRDISDRKRFQAELEKSNDELRQAIIRTNEMAERAEAATVAKSNFLATMSHELRTPMNSVIGFMDLLIGTPLNEEQASYAELVRSNAMSLLTLINDILDFSKMETVGIELRDEPFDLQSMLDEYTTMCAVQVSENDLELVCMTDPDVPVLLKGDAARLRQVLVNLTGNAVKFTLRGEIAVRVSRLAETPDTVDLRFSVSDTGIGISEEEQGKLFNSFSQIDSSATRKYNGSGLGLAISKQLVKLMHGEIGVFSSEGRGSEFWFTVRFAKQAECGTPPPEYPEIRGKRVLVADASAANRMMLMLRLHSLGARIEEDPNGTSILEVLHAAHIAGDPFHALMLDLRFLGNENDTIVGRIKADPDLADLRVIVMARQGEHDAASVVKKFTKTVWMKKPIAQAHLLACLRNHCS
jgi:PAS domain S-box-containing protein